MKKSTLMIIFIIYFASIVLISVFGMRAIIHTEVVPVQKVECLNETDDKVNVEIEDGKKVIKVKFTTPGDEQTLSGTMVQLFWRVTPDDATDKAVEFIYTESPRVKFVEDASGNQLGLILFSGKIVLNVRIMATDGSRAYTDIVVWAY